MLEIDEWNTKDGIPTSGAFRLLVLDERLTKLHDFDSRLNDLGLKPQLVVFASRHEAKAGLPWLGGHFPGIIEADKSPALSAASPRALSLFLHGLRHQALHGYAISAEATHHGPADMLTPCLFAEIGSTVVQWSDKAAGAAVARAIYGIGAHAAMESRALAPSFLGFGGGHYVARQTELIMQTEVSFGHMFSNYQIDALSTEAVVNAARLSASGHAYLDRKSLRSDGRVKVLRMTEEAGLSVLRGKEIRERFPATNVRCGALEG
jgi:D-aminoacyl-tRNA deacylase